MTCTITGKSYVGKGDGKKRWIAHQRNAKIGRKTHFYDAIRKHGPENFVLTIESEYQSQHEAYAHEAKIIASENLMREGYNSAPGLIVHVNHDMIDIRRAETVKHSWTTTRRQALAKQYSGNGNPFHGKHHTENTKIAIGYASSTNIDAHRKISDALRGRFHSLETKEKMSLASPTRGKTWDDVFGADRASQIKQKLKENQPNRAGENHPSAKLTVKDVLTIRERSLGRLTDAKLAEEFGVSIRTIEKIRLRHSWKHI